eukprot:TRINITY_DN582_c0_g1_i1.p2 TRINITY_DN582_c0_g1~~TRINITY_DN582_c0_g1_i1.p2  ORF type:complete len:205 (+),score=36.21 TRINITY_DN582_c0_g1_i1:839-1453(+)
MSRIARQFAVACALALKLPPHHLSHMLQTLDLATLRLLHYPPCEFVAGHSTGEHPTAAIRVGEHSDYGLFTLLFCDAPGLQVSAPPHQTDDCVRQQPWLDVPLPPGGCAIVTPGALMARLTNDHWKGTLHRVVVHHAQMAQCSRYSLAYFADPDESTVIQVHPRFVSRQRAAKYEPTTAGAYENARLRSAVASRSSDGQHVVEL